MNPDILHYVIEGVISAFLVFLAFRRAPGERAKDNSGALKDYAESARIAGEEARLAREETRQAREETIRAKEELEKRMGILERKRYRCIVDFEIGDPPIPGEVIIIPVIPDPKTVQPPIRHGKKP